MGLAIDLISSDPGKTGQRSAGGGFEGDLNVTQYHAPYDRAAKDGRIYCFGISNTALVSQNAIATGLTATAQPVIGVYNNLPGFRLSILKVILKETTIANSAVNPGGYAWVYSQGNAGLISTGSQPINASSFLTDGLGGLVYAVGTAVTGLKNSLAFLRACPIGGINAAGPATAITQPAAPCEEIVDGCISVPYGGIVGLMNQVSVTTVSVSVGIVYEKIPV